MTVEITLKTGNSLGLTEKCRDIKGFMKSVNTRKQRDMLEHLRICPACMKVALDTILALTSQGDTREDPSLVEDHAKVMTSGSNEEDVCVAVLAVGSEIVDVSGLTYERAPRGGTIHSELTVGAAQVRVEIEADNGVFLIKLGVKLKSDLIVVLRNSSGEPVLPPRKLTGTLSFTGLKPGAYHLVMAGKSGTKKLTVKMAMNQNETL